MNQPTDKPRVAVIEDDPDITEIIRFALENDGCQVRSARDGVDGVSLAMGWQPDLVLMDVAMPRKDGLTAVREIRANRRIRQMPVIMITARARGEDVQAALSSGADDYLVKPFDLSALLTKVRRKLVTRTPPPPPRPSLRVPPLEL